MCDLCSEPVCALPLTLSLKQDAIGASVATQAAQKHCTASTHVAHGTKHHSPLLSVASHSVCPCRRCAVARALQPPRPTPLPPTPPPLFPLTPPSAEQWRAHAGSGQA